jgi:hypothetical protein
MQPSSGSDHEPKDKKTVDSSLDVDHDQEVCDIEWYLYYIC